MQAVILVAGVSRRLFPLTEFRPKCLMEIGGQTIFDYQMQALMSVGVQKVCLVVGYRREQIQAYAETHYPEIEFSYLINHFFFDTNTAYSLWIAGEEFVDRNFIYLNGDVLFEPRLLQRVMASPHGTALAVECKPCGEEEVKVVVDDEGRIHEIGKALDPSRCAGEFIGVARFNATVTSYLFKALERLKVEGHRNVYFEAALADMAGEHAFHMVDVTDLPCVEIDFQEDYESARTAVLSRFQSED